VNLNIKRFVTVALPVVALVMVGATGCANKKKPATGPSAKVLDVSPSPVVTATPSQPQFEPVAPLPTPAPAVETGPVKVASAGGSYTVKKGDTLFSIARAHYGNGNQWQKIASANPGVQPSKLRVGQTITLP
jgi:5'-nucleotidase